MKSITDNNIYAIFAQAPLRATISHFWCALYHFGVKSIFMLCALEDKIRGVILIVSRYKLKNIGRQKINNSNWIISNLLLNANQPKKFRLI